jgi:hypothetical protein
VGGSYSEGGKWVYVLNPKFAISHRIELATNYHLSKVQLREIEAIIEAHYDELKAAWDQYFRT